MAELPILAYGFATTFKMRDLAPCFAGAKVRMAKGQIVAEYGPDRVAVGFDFGAVVFLNISAEERARVLGSIITKVAVDEPHPPLEEDFFLEVRPGLPTSGEVRFERVIVPELNSQIIELVCLLFAQSVSIDYYEEDLQEILATLDVTTDRMAKRGQIPGTTREFTRFVGGTIGTKNQIIAALAVLDKPAVTWESESLDKLYRDLHKMLEIDERYKALEFKLRTIQETMELFLDLSQTRRMLFLEATVVVLILLEIVVTLLIKL